MFGRKRMTEAEIEQRMREIEDMSEEDAFRAALALEKDAPEAAAVTLSNAYLLGRVTDQDFQRCLDYAKLGLRKYPDNGLLWYLGGVASDLLEDYVTAINMLSKAREFEGFELVAATSYASSCYSYACQLRNVAAGTLRIDVYSKGNYQAAVWYAECAGIFAQVADQDDTALSDTDWQIYTAAANMLLAMAYQGQLTDLGAADNRVGSWLSASFKALDAKMDDGQKDFWKEYCYGACVQMDRAGKHLVAETLRTYTCLLECRFEHSGDALYRAQWHYGKVRDLLKTADEDERDAWNKYCGDLYGEYTEMKRKYGSIALNKMLDGILPNLAPSYPEGEAPDPESCAGFMEEFHRERDMSQMKHDLRTGKGDKSEKKKGGLFGLFRK